MSEKEQLLKEIELLNTLIMGLQDLISFYSSESVIVPEEK